MAPKTEVAELIHSIKYRTEGESFRDAMQRVAFALSDNGEHYHQIRKILLDQRFMPAGRVQAAMGSGRNVTPYNCYVSGTIEDSFTDGQGSIMQRATEAASTLRMGGGIGYDFSTLRPSGDLIMKLGSYSSGPVSFMEVFNSICSCVASAGHRRGAQMAVMRVDHPDIDKFISCKHANGKLTGFNISVAVTDKFMEAVKSDGDFDLVFNGKVYRTIRARELWEKIMRSTWEWAEPGVLFIDRINQMNNLNYCETIAATNPCVEGKTPILTLEYGYIPISEVIGENVHVWNGECWSLTTPKITGHNQDMVTVKFSDGSEIRCTKGHKFIGQDGVTKVEAANLSEGFKILKHSWPVIIEGVEPNIDGYSQGFFAGDGWVKTETNGHDWNEQSRHEYDITGGFENTDTDQTKEYLYFGQGHFAPKDYVPFDTNLEWRKQWLAGLVDSDGYVTNDSCIQISSKNRQFLHDVKLMLNTMGATGTLSEMKDCFRLSISSNYANELQLPLKRHTVKPVSFSKARFVHVTEIVESGTEQTVYCFTENMRHMGIFAGVLTGQCGEQPLPPFGACLLGSFNLPQYIFEVTPVPGDGAPYLGFDMTALIEDIPAVVRAMDNVVDRAVYPLEQQRQEATSKRRMGLGITGLANVVETLGMPYGSPEAVKWTSNVLKTIANTAYMASAMLAKEKGSFELYNETEYLKSLFVQKLDPEVQQAIKENGIRNSHLTSIAPTGTISLSANNVSSGIEPVFSKDVERPINLPGHEGKVFRITDYAYAIWGTEPRDFTQVKAQEHIAMLCAAQEWVDSSVSKTCNVSGEMDWDDFKALYMAAYEGGAKGCTTYTMGASKETLIKKAEPEGGESCKFDPATGERSCE